MTDPWRDPTAVGVVYPDPTAPVFIAPIVLPEPDPVYRDDALFAAAGANWRPAPPPVPPVPVLDESGQLVLLPPTAAMLRDEAVAALKAPPPHVQARASRGGARSTYVAEPAERPSRRPGPARPPGSVTTSPSTWLPSTGPTPTAGWRQQPAPPTWLPSTGPTPTAPWRQQAAPPTWLPQAPGQPQRPTTASRRTGSGRAGPVTYREGDQTPGAGPPRPSRRRRGSSKGWIPGLVVLAFVILANVVPHLGSVFHRGVPSGVSSSVAKYYTSAESGNVPAAAAEICASSRSAWTAGQISRSSDTKRGIAKYAITSTRAGGSNNYTVRVNLRLTSGVTSSAALKVVKEGGDYFVCSGTSP